MNGKPYRANMESESRANLDERIKIGNQLHDRAIGDFFARLMSKVVFSSKGLSVSNEAPGQRDGLSLNPSHPVAV